MVIVVAAQLNLFCLIQVLMLKKIKTIQNFCEIKYVNNTF